MDTGQPLDMSQVLSAVQTDAEPENQAAQSIVIAPDRQSVVRTARRDGLDIPLTTTFGADVSCIYNKAHAWALAEEHGQITLGHFLFATTELEVGARALEHAEVIGVAELETELLNLVHKSPTRRLPLGGSPTPDDELLSVLSHSLGYASRSGRQESNLDDVLAALADALRAEDAKGPAMLALLRRWPRAQHRDPVQDLLLQVRETLYGIRESQFAQADFARRVDNELNLLGDRVAQIATLGERVAALETPPAPRQLPWYRRLQVLVPTVACFAFAAGMGVLSVMQ